jgi:hypothetical protein
MNGFHVMMDVSSWEVGSVHPCLAGIFSEDSMSACRASGHSIGLRSWTLGHLHGRIAQESLPIATVAVGIGYCDE